MNRETWRQIRQMNWREADQMIRMVYDPLYNDQIQYNMKRFMAELFTALHDRFPDIMTGDILHSISADALELDHGIEPPEELIENLFQATGFDIRLRVEEQQNNYIPKGA